MSVKMILTIVLDPEANVVIITADFNVQVVQKER